MRSPTSNLLDDRPACERIIAGALRDAVNAHGPITRQQIGSAAKRVQAQLRAEAKRRRA